MAERKAATMLGISRTKERLQPIQPPRTPSAPPTAASDLWIDPEFRTSLAEAGLATLEAGLTAAHGKRLRAVDQRENWRFDLPGRAAGAYLKRHREAAWWRPWARALNLAPRAAGVFEAQQTRAVREAGIATMRVIAYGQRPGEGGAVESFLLTEELAGYTQLDHFLRQRFTARKPGPSSEGDRQLRSLARAVARVAAEFHGAGFNHRDLYCCHFFVRETAPGAFDVRLIDLQRVQRRTRWRGRWIVKDLAQLAYSAPAELIGPALRMRFFKAYLNNRRLGLAERRLARQVVAKQNLMQRTLGPHP